MQQIINTENGTLYFGNQEYIDAKTTYDEILKMKGTIDDAIELPAMGTKSLHYHHKEIDGDFYQFSFCFNFEKLSMIFIQFKEGKRLLALPVWKELKYLKQYSNPKKNTNEM